MFPKHKFYSVFVLALIGLLTLSACAPAASDTPHTISVTGSGTAYGKPDTAVAQIGVQTRNADAGQAVEENTQKMNAIVAALTEAGIEAKDTQTTNFSVYTNQKYDNQGQPTEIEYIADNTVTITVRDINKIGDVLSEVVSAGANNIYGISFTVSDKSALEADARAKAMADAKARADQLAQAAGVTLGAPMSINEFTSGPIPYAADVRSVELAQGGGAVPVSGGEVQVQLQVTVTYLIK